VPGVPEGSLRVETLGPQHDRGSFTSGAEPLDRYLRSQAGQDARKNMAAPFVLVLPGGAIGGYYTLSATGVKHTEFPADITRKLPRYPLVPATLLGRLAVDQNPSGARVRPLPARRRAVPRGTKRDRVVRRCRRCQG